MHLPFKHSKQKARRGYSLEVVYLSIIGIAILFVILLLPDIATLILGTKVTIRVISTIEFKDKLNICARVPVKSSPIPDWLKVT